MKNIIEVNNFSMIFGNKQVVNNLNFVVKKGETFGFLGSNGSGKTTTLRAMLGIYTPTSGQLLISGKEYDVSQSTRIGYLPEERGLYKKESVIDTMTYFGELKGLTRSQAKESAMKYLEKVSLSSYSSTRVDKLSGGQQQKIQLGITVMGDPEILILDEPTKGFDPVNRRLLMDIIEDCQKRGATIIMVSHQMDEVEKLCDRVLLLKDGEAKEYGTVLEIRKKYQDAHMDEIFVKIYSDTEGVK